MLTSAQLSTIDQHLRKENWLLNEDLIAELTDHYIQGISERLDQGMEFSVALRDIHTGFGGRKGLLKMERHYNRVTYRQYDTLFMKIAQQQNRWPYLLTPVSIYAIVFWATTHTSRPISFSFNSLLCSFALGSIGGLLIQFFRLLFQQGIYNRNISYKAIYLATRFLPITIFLYGFIAALTNWAHLFPPYVYEGTLSACVSIAVVYMVAYSHFHKAIFKPSINN
ncbi:hypothetical protein [Spirosoma horti]